MSGCSRGKLCLHVESLAYAYVAGDVKQFYCANNIFHESVLS